SACFAGASDSSDLAEVLFSSLAVSVWGGLYSGYVNCGTSSAGSGSTPPPPAPAAWASGATDINGRLTSAETHAPWVQDRLREKSRCGWCCECRAAAIYAIPRRLCRTFGQNLPGFPATTGIPALIEHASARSAHAHFSTSG